tara:strand:- start:544 stop:864 length:321 start_codon:yes stop_codon:yes gene_type:complete
MQLNSNINYEWYVVESNNLIPRIMNRYFSVKAGTEYKCDLFLVEGVPCASFLYNKVNGKTIIEEFHLNKGMALLFDAGPHMRKKLYTHHHSLDLSRIHNKNDILFF